MLKNVSFGYIEQHSQETLTLNYTFPVAILLAGLLKRIKKELSG